MNKPRALTLGLISGMAIIGGIILAVLLQQVIVTVVDGHTQLNVTSDMADAVYSVSGVTWIFGLVYIIPGILGVIAALVQNKCMYVTTCVFTMLCLFLMGIIFLIAGLTLIVLVLGASSMAETCTDTGEVCRCRTAVDNSYENTAFRTCAHFSKFVNLFTAVTLFIVLSWGAVLAEFIASCYFSCRTTSGHTSGAVLVASQQPMLPTGEEVGPPPYGSPYPPPSKV